MSVLVLTRVWLSYPGGGSELLALLALADWSDDNGRCYPSMMAIAKKVRLSRSQVQRVVHKLIEDKFISVIGNDNGGAPGSTRQYRIALARLTGCTDATGSTDATGRTGARDGPHGCAETGRMDATQTVMYTSKNRHSRVAPRNRVNNKAKVNAPTDTSECFQTAWQEYPRRAGDNPKVRAINAWNARLQDGHSEEEMLAGVRRYAAYARANGMEGSRYVKQTATFFGPDKPFLEDWQAMAGKAGADSWKAGQEPWAGAVNT